jgi:squalene-hopene/tetraprenyl-beta-curcumene cyclase
MIANKDGGVLSETSEWSASGRSAGSGIVALEALETALERTSNWLLARQKDEGYWVGELEGDTILESEYVLLMAFLGRESDRVCARCAVTTIAHVCHLK